MATETDEQTEEQTGEGLQLGEAEPLSDEALALSTRPLLQLGWMLDQCETVLAQAEKKLDAAEADYARATDSRQFRTQGEWQAVQKECAPALLEARAAAAEAKDDVYRQARAIQEVTSENREPQLSDVDAIRANSRREFVKEDCLEQPLRVVLSKVQGALTTSDPALTFLYHRYVIQRLQEQRAADKPDAAVRLQLVKLLENMTDRLIDKRASVVSARAKEIRKKAVEFTRRTGPPTAGRVSNFGKL